MRATTQIDPVEIYRLVIFDADKFANEQLTAMLEAINNELKRRAKFAEDTRLDDLAKEAVRRR